MNSYNFTLASSPILLILSILVAFVFTYFTYKNTVPEINRYKKSFLISLRTLALSVLLFILFEPVLEMLGIIETAPKIAVLLDNSASSGIATEKINNKSHFDNAVNSIINQDLENVDFYKFGSETLKTEKDSILSLNFNDQNTNLDDALQRIARIKEDENINSVILISDGNINSGGNPLYEPYLKELVINSIVIGDTNLYKDIVVRSLISNDVAYINSALPVEAIVTTDGFKNDSIMVNLLRNNRIIDSQKLFVYPNKNNYKVRFQFKADKVGSVKLTVNAEEKKNEIDLKNNNKSVIVKILDDKKKISLFAGSPSYDVATISKFLTKDQSVQLDKFIQKKGSEFYNNPTEKQLLETGLFIFIGFPNKFSDKNVLDKINQRIEEGTPFLMIFSKDLDNFSLSKFSRNLPFKVISASKSEFQALPYVEKDKLANSLINLTGSDSDLELWNNLPPLFRTETFLELKQGAEALVKVALNGTRLNEALVISQDLNNKKSVVISGYGLHRWKLESFAQNKTKGIEQIDLLDKFLQNTFKWLSVKDNKNKFTISTDKKEYVNGESVFISATLFDDKLVALDNAEIKVKISDSTEKREIILNNNSIGKYSGVIDGLNSGDYKLNASAFYRNKLQANDSDRFTIGETAVENLSYNANIDFLSKISNESGGKVYYPSNSDNLINEIKNNPRFVSKKTKETNLFEVWQKPWLLGFAILLFSIEWFIRRKSGLL